MDNKSLPLDWEDFKTPFRGVSRNEKQRGYLAVLLLNGRQNHFGPFTESRRQAAQAYDALLRYFLPFVKSKPVPNCPAQVFLELDNQETENKYGKERLQKLYAKLKAESERAGLNIDVEASRRLDFIVGHCGLGSEKLTSRRDQKRRKALIHLEAHCLNLMNELNLVKTLTELDMPSHEQAKHVAPELELTSAAFRAAQFQLSKLIVRCKLVLDLDPEQSTK
jgi:hypothetical protein